MSKTLSNILTIFKIAKIFAKVVFILCIVGGAGCLIALTTLPLVENIVPIQSLVEEEIEFSSVYPACIAGLITCVGEAIFAFMAEHYFGNVLSAGTPFTFEGAKESFRLGLASIIISVATSVIAGLAIPFVAVLVENVSEFDLDASISLSTGLFFLFMSLIFKHGAELRASITEEPKQEESTSELQSR